jgi:tetratricopeptide (TPR) repeat protein
MKTVDELIDETNALFASNKYEETLAALPDDLLEEYNDPQLFSNAAAAYFQLENSEKSIALYERAIALRESEYDFFCRGVVLQSKNELELAIADFTKATEISNEYAEAFYWRASSYLNLKNYNKAIADFSKAIALVDDYSEAYNDRGVAYELKGDYEKAILDYEEASKINKDFTLAKQNLEFAIQKRDDQLKQQTSEVDQTEKEEKEKIEKEIQKIIEKIKRAAISTVKTVVHYTKVFVADIYVSQPNTKMQYSNAIYMNDPMEGQIFFDYLKGNSKDNPIEEAYRNGERRTETSVYLGSFMPIDERDDTVDQLVMWRTYGKDEKGIEAAGCSVVLDTDFFRTKTASHEKPDSNPGMVSEDLLSVIYIKKNKDGLEINEKLKKKVTTLLDNLKEQLNLLLTLGKRHEESNQDFFREIENSIFTNLSKISYLFKSADYEFENEVRVINYIDREKHHDSVKFRTIENGPSNAPKKRFYIESKHDILPFIQKIYLGPKVENYHQWSLYFDYEIRQRAKEFKKMEADSSNQKAPYQIDAKKIEVIKSKCSFQ